MQSAPANQDSRCDPGPPQGATVPATVSTCPRRNWRLPAGEVNAVVRGAVMVGRVISGCPMAARIAGRRKTSNDTYELTGLPGSVTIGTDRSPTAYRPAPCGIPGCIATLANSMPCPVSASLTTS